MDVGYSRRQRSRDMSWGCVRLGPDLDFAVERPLYGLILSQGGVQRDVNYGLNSGPCPPGASGDLSQEWRFRHVEILNLLRSCLPSSNLSLLAVTK